MDDYPDIIELPILCVWTKREGPAVWAEFGDHGEEPAGPNDFALNLEAIAEMGKLVSMVVWPLFNASGYLSDWRYENEKRDWKRGLSVSAADHVLIDPKSKSPHPRPEKVSPAARAVVEHTLALLLYYPCLMSINHHEDEDRKTKNKRILSYIYSQGVWGSEDWAAQEVVKILERMGMLVCKSGKTRFGETITNGIVSATHDGSFDELLATDKVILDDKIQPGPQAKTVIVAETPTKRNNHTRPKPIPLGDRVNAHGEIIKNYQKLLFLRLLQEKTIA